MMLGNVPYSNTDPLADSLDSFAVGCTLIFVARFAETLRVDLASVVDSN